jgi:hypothetical protein
VLIYTQTITPRLQYIADFFGKLITGTSFKLTTDKQFYCSSTIAKLNYSDEKITATDFWIKPHSLLFENGISEQIIECFEIGEGQKVFFKTRGDFPFDVFAASFYLISRYEEYLPHEKDMYGRYAHENSLAYREGFLHQPVVNIWLAFFAETVKQKFPLFATFPSAFTFLPTYDIDIAWSYKHKGLWHTTGKTIQALLTGNIQQFRERINVFREKQKDPFDSYDWLNRLHEKHKLKPYYFFLLAGRKGKYDKNISAQRKALQQLISDHLTRYQVGIHPSWRSGDEHSLVKMEIDILQVLTNNNVLFSRQHYIRFKLPDTFRRLIKNGIQFDFSMGYGSINGFRASVAAPFYWYDLEKEKQTGLMLFPFCYMDANSFYEQKYSPQQALDEMRQYYRSVKSVNGTLVMIWHNQFLGTDKLYDGWKNVYQQFIEEINSVV